MAEGSAQRLYLEDLSVGQILRSETLLVEPEAVHAFASAFDPQPFHLDDAAAQPTIFKGLAASGWHTAALTMRLLVSTVPFAGGLIGAGAEVTWMKPLRPGDVIRIEAEIVEIRPSATRPQGRVKMLTTTYNQRDEAIQTILSSMIVTARGGAIG